jgi:hypothetical protein
VDIDDVCEAIAAAITTAALTVGTARVTATPYTPDAVVAPHFHTAEWTATYDRSFAGLTELVLTARLLLSRADDKSAQKAAQQLASTGASTIVATLKAARGAPGQSALSGAADDLHVRSVAGPRLYAYGDDQYYGLEFTIFVMG